MKVCPSCGFENTDEDRFCAQCGNTLVAPQPEPVPSSLAEPGAGAPAPVRSGQVDPTLKVIILIGTLLVPLLGIIMGAIYLGDPSPEKKAVGKLWLGVGIGMAVLGAICVCVSSMSGSTSY